MRRFVIVLSIVFFIAPGCVSTLAQDVSKEQVDKKGDSKSAFHGLAERMAAHLSRTLPEKLSQLKTQRNTPTSASTPVVAKESARPTGQKPADISVDLQDSQDAARPRIKLPDDKPLGAAGPSRDDKEVSEDADFMVMEDRWRIGVPDDPRFRKGSIFNPYRQNVLKGDYPIIGNDIFMNLTLESESDFNYRRLPVDQNNSSVRPGSFEFFGRGRQVAFNQNFIFSFDMFKGDASFKPVDWRFKFTGVANINYLRVQERGLVNADVRRGQSRLDQFNSINEAFFEWRLGDTPRVLPFLRGKGSQGGRSPEFDTSSMRVGVQEFNSDFRGFIFNDKNLGMRMFGNAASNRYQYNAAYFYMLEKDTFTGLNQLTFTRARFRDQRVAIFNVYRQDTFVKGYTAQMSLHFNSDQPSTLSDKTNLLVRPVRIGTVRPKQVRSGYIGWTGDGHFGRYNITHAFYQVIGRETFNPIADRGIRINAQMAAAEFSIDFDYLRYRIAGFYTSGDSKPFDGVGRGFDAILDRPNFAGGEFSFFNSQGIRLTQTGAAVVEPDSLIPSLRSTKIQGQSNFVNPGLGLVNFGVDADLTPKLRGFLNYNYIRFNRTETLEFLLQDTVRHEFGHDLGIGFIYRPLLNENIVLTSGASTLRGGAGFTDLFTSNCNGDILQGCGSRRPTLYSVFAKLKFQY